MWTTANRPKYNRDKLRYPSDLTGEEWAHIEALIAAAKHCGRKRKVDVREVVNGIMYVLSTGCQWRMLPFRISVSSSERSPQLNRTIYFFTTISFAAMIASVAGRDESVKSFQLR